MEEALHRQEALVADCLRQLEQTAFHGAKKMSTQLYCALHATVYSYGGPPWTSDDRTQFLQAVYEQYSSEAQAVAERSVARLAGQQHGERYAQALFGELSSFAYYARVSSNLFSKARGRLEIAPLTFLKFGEALDRGAEVLAKRVGVLGVHPKAQVHEPHRRATRRPPTIGGGDAKPLETQKRRAVRPARATA